MSSARTPQKTFFVAVYRPLRSNSLCPIVSWSLPSSGSTCHNTKHVSILSGQNRDLFKVDEGIMCTKPFGVKASCPLLEPKYVCIWWSGDMQIGLKFLLLKYRVRGRNMAEWFVPVPLDCHVLLAKQFISFTDFVYSLARDLKITARN
jgi:hypothetical protein